MSTNPSDIRTLARTGKGSENVFYKQGPHSRQPWTVRAVALGILKIEPNKQFTIEIQFQFMIQFYWPFAIAVLGTVFFPCSEKRSCFVAPRRPECVS